MASPSFGISKKDAGGNPVWLEVIADLHIARRHLRQLASLIPGEYFAFDQRIRQVLAGLVRLSSDRF
jgi:hypothetical protein